jgi:glyoxylase-like metal-dependent hydrolase (beta-lactamase superfamily II)
MFSGDTLFAGSCGRTDLPGGDWATIQDSLIRLRELEGDFTVYPGHGDSTTLAAERQYNPYLRG